MDVLDKQQLKGFTGTFAGKVFLPGRVCILNSSGKPMKTSRYHLSWCRALQGGGGGSRRRRDQNSLMMLSLDLPTPTHFTEMRRRRDQNSIGRFWQSEQRRWLQFPSPLNSSISLQTWHLQEVLDEPNVILSLHRKLLEAPSRLCAAAPAGQRFVFHFHLCQNVHVCCKRKVQRKSGPGKSSAPAHKNPLSKKK